MAIEFRLIADPDTTEYRTVRTASQAYTVGDVVDQDRTSDAIDVVPSTASSITAAIYGVCMQTIVSTATSMDICLLSPRQRWSADTTNASNTNHNYQRMILTDKGTVNNTGTDVAGSTGVFQQLGILGATSANRIVGRFLPGMIEA